MFIPYGKQNIISKILMLLFKCCSQIFLTQGPQVPLFEKTVEEYVGAEYALAVNSATSALHIACLALGLQKEMYCGHLLLLLWLLRIALFIVVQTSIL